MARPEHPVQEPDAREQTPMFRSLPEHAKEEFRERWRAQDGRTERQVKRRIGTEVRYVIEGVMLFALLEFLFFGLGVGRLALLTVPGIAMGWICHKIRADRWRYVGVAFLFYVAVYGAFGLFLVGHFIVFIGVAAGLGFTHEMLREDGTEG
jgi:hypothetical protein